MGSQDDINNDDNDVSNDVNASPEEELRDVVLSTMTIYLLGFWLEWLVLEEPWHVFWELSRPADFRKSCRAIKPIINQFQIEVPDL